MTPVAFGGSGSESSGNNYSGLAVGSYTFTATVVLTDGGSATATRQFSVATPAFIATTATPGGGAVAPGSAQHDVAAIEGPPGEPAPTGTLTFTLCGPAEVTVAGCPAGSGRQVGSPVTISAGSGTSQTVTGLTTPNDLAAGKYCWRTDYTPDPASSSIYPPSSETDATAECFTIVRLT
jgi:hypothetical protein